MLKEELKKLCIEAIDNNKEKIIQFGKNIYETPELGYKEFKTTEKVISAFKDLGQEVETEIAYTGCRISSGSKSSPVIAVIGELDSIICPSHKDANSDGNVHACGHHVQLANLYGSAIGLLNSGVINKLDGRVDFIAIPSEECVDYGYRTKLINEGKIKYFGGKQEALYRGKFDNIDIYMQCHMKDFDDGKKCIVNSKCDGFMTKIVKFIGKSSHAGFAPHEGINALNMANLAINNINALRETFKDEDKVRVSAIITNGGDLVNVVPDTVCMEIMVRAFTTDAIIEINKKITKALKAAAFALSGSVEINDRVGYLPLKTDEELSNLYKNNMIEYGNASDDDFVEMYETAGSTDLGDLSQIKPCMHIWASGITGGLHTADFKVGDNYTAYVLPAKMLALTVIDLLYDNAEKAKNIMSEFKANFTKEEYLDFLDKNTFIDLFDGSDL